MPKTYNVEKYKCTKCFADLDKATTTDGRGPKVGDASLCVNCGHIMQFAENGVQDFPIELLRINLTSEMYAKAKISSKWCADKFFQKNGFYVSELFKSM
jgi:DNA-directed RNA polymerase subunit RPC12/RpoP